MAKYKDLPSELRQEILQYVLKAEYEHPPPTVSQLRRLVGNPLAHTQFARPDLFPCEVPFGLIGCCPAEQVGTLPRTHPLHPAHKTYNKSRSNATHNNKKKSSKSVGLGRGALLTPPVNSGYQQYHPTNDFDPRERPDTRVAAASVAAGHGLAGIHFGRARGGTQTTPHASHTVGNPGLQDYGDPYAASLHSYSGWLGLPIHGPTGMPADTQHGRGGRGGRGGFGYAGRGHTHTNHPGGTQAYAGPHTGLGRGGSHSSRGALTIQQAPHTTTHGYFGPPPTAVNTMPSPISHNVGPLHNSPLGHSHVAHPVTLPANVARALGRQSQGSRTPIMASARVTHPVMGTDSHRNMMTRDDGSGDLLRLCSVDRLTRLDVAEIAGLVVKDLSHTISWLIEQHEAERAKHGVIDFRRPPTSLLIIQTYMQVWMAYQQQLIRVQKKC